MARIVVVGASIAGLSSALLLARAGHEVLVLDGDDVAPGTPAQVVERALRPGAPHAVHTHAFLARGRMVLRDRLPDVLTELREQGVADLVLPPPPALSGQAIEHDADLVFLMVRRPLAEWALRRVSAAQAGLEVRWPVKVTGLCVDGSGSVPRVTGVTVRGGPAHHADLVIDASGRRSSSVRWLNEACPVQPLVRSEECGLVYFSRAYRVRDGVADLPALNRGFAAGAPMPRFTTLLAPCENGHVVASITPLAADRAMKAVRAPAVFDAVLRTVGVISPWLDVLEPSSEVYAMGGLQSTLVRTVRAGAPVVHGLHVVGDACSTTSPTYGRGLSFALAHAAALADTLAEHPDDADMQAHVLDAWIGSEIAPFYDDAVGADRARVAAMRSAMPGEDAAPITALTSAAFAADAGRPTFAQIISASGVDAYVWHRFARYQSLLATPRELYDDPALRERVATLSSATIPSPRPPGPTNDELAAILA